MEANKGIGNNYGLFAFLGVEYMNEWSHGLLLK